MNNTWKKNNMLNEDFDYNPHSDYSFNGEFDEVRDDMTHDLYEALCKVYKKWSNSEYDVPSLIDMCFEEAAMRAEEANC